MNYYDANAVAEESAAARYTNHEPPTLCDCGAVAESGQVYCKVCLDMLDLAMQNSVKLLIHTGLTEDEAEQAICYWLEHTEEFKERRNVKTI